MFDGTTAWVGPSPSLLGDHLTVGFRPNDIVFARSGNRLPGIIRRASFLGSHMDYLIDAGGVSLRASIDSRHALSDGMMFGDGEACRINFHTVQWFEEVLPESAVKVETHA